MLKVNEKSLLFYIFFIQYPYLYRSMFVFSKITKLYILQILCDEWTCFAPDFSTEHMFLDLHTSYRSYAILPNFGWKTPTPVFNLGNFPLIFKCKILITKLINFINQNLILYTCGNWKYNCIILILYKDKQTNSKI